jgi:hypothetical protein
VCGREGMVVGWAGTLLFFNDYKFLNPYVRNFVLFGAALALQPTVAIWTEREDGQNPIKVQ